MLPSPTSLNCAHACVCVPPCPTVPDSVAGIGDSLSELARPISGRRMTASSESGLWRLHCASFPHALAHAGRVCLHACLAVTRCSCC
jgi:hypothetical protein